jgi:hypothetical protein
VQADPDAEAGQRLAQLLEAQLWLQPSEIFR